MNRAEFELKIDQANRHFDPEIEKQERRAIQEAKMKTEKEIADKIATELEALRKAEAKKKQKRSVSLLLK